MLQAVTDPTLPRALFPAFLHLELGLKCPSNTPGPETGGPIAFWLGVDMGGLAIGLGHEKGSGGRTVDPIDEQDMGDNQ